MARNTRRTLREQRDQDQANHWIGIPETGSIVDLVNGPIGYIIDAHPTPKTDPPAQTLNIPKPEPLNLSAHRMNNGNQAKSLRLLRFQAK